MLLSAAGPALLSCALSLLHRADSVAVVDPVLKDECHRIETWCSEFVRELVRGPSRELTDMLLTDVRVDVPRSCRVMLRHEVHTLVCTLQALRAPSGDRFGDATDLAAKRDKVVARVSQLAVPLLPSPEAFPLVQELCMHARALHADFVAALVRRLEAGEAEAPPLVRNHYHKYHELQTALRMRGPPGTLARIDQQRVELPFWLQRPAAELRQLLAVRARPWLVAPPPTSEVKVAALEKQLQASQALLLASQAALQALKPEHVDLTGGKEIDATTIGRKRSSIACLVEATEKNVKVKVELQEKCRTLVDEKEDLEDLTQPLLAQNRTLQTRLDALFFVGVCVAGGRQAGNNHELAEVGATTLSKIRLLPPTATLTQVGEVVRDFLESSHVKLDAIRAGALGLTLRAVGNKEQLVGLIMAQKFI